MKRSQLFATISKEEQSGLDCRSAELMVKAGLVKNFGTGTWSYTHLGEKVLENLESIIREQMDDIGQEVRMNQLQTSEIWKESGRWQNFEGEEFFNFKNRDDKDFTISATHEEAATELAKDYIRSYRDLDLTIYQIGRKYRDDHARKGLLRAKEFIMKDAYSFHRDQESLDQKYNKFIESYTRIFEKMGLEFSRVEADNGSMGGNRSHEFMAESEVGSDTYLKCTNQECRYASKDMEVDKCEECGSDLRKVNGIEIGHCFQLQHRYSEAMDLTFTDQNGEEQNVLMASYGIGVSRLISAIIEQNNDESGITWNRKVSAFTTAVIVAGEEKELVEKADEVQEALDEEALIFDGDRSVGEKFAEADLIGVNRKVILGNNYLETGKIEVETRSGETTEVEKATDL